MNGFYKYCASYVLVPNESHNVESHSLGANDCRLHSLSRAHMHTLILYILCYSHKIQSIVWAFRFSGDADCRIRFHLLVLPLSKDVCNGWSSADFALEHSWSLRLIHGYGNQLLIEIIQINIRTSSKTLRSEKKLKSFNHSIFILPLHSKYSNDFVNRLFAVVNKNISSFFFVLFIVLFIILIYGCLR